MPRITVHLFATLRELRGAASEELTVPEGTTAAEAYALLFPSPRVPVGFAINLEHSPGRTVLREGDALALLPPIGGG